MHKVNQNLFVAARVRPITRDQGILFVEDDLQTITIKDINGKTNFKEQEFVFQHVFDENSKQVEIFNTVTDQCLKSLLEGINGCFLSYGQTTSGKSYSLFGDDKRYSNAKFQKNKRKLGPDKQNRRGVIPLSMEYFLEYKRDTKFKSNLIIKCAFYEIYLNEVRDLGRNYQVQYSSQSDEEDNEEMKNQFSYKKHFQKKIKQEILSINEDDEGKIFIENLKWHEINDIRDVYGLIKSAFQIQSQYKPNPIKIVERTHTIFTVQVEFWDLNTHTPLTEQGPSSMSFVDLAGSERMAKSLSENNKFKEAILISSAFSALNKVLLAVASEQKEGVPYRESKLTRALQNNLSYDSKVFFLANIHPGEPNFEECLQTVQYTERCKNVEIKNKVASAHDQSFTQVAEQGFGQINAKMLEKQEKIDLLNKQLKTKKDNHNKKILKLRNLLGLDFSLKKVLETRKVGKEIEILTKQKEAVTGMQNVQGIKEKLEDKINGYYKEMESKRKKESEIYEQHKEKLFGLRTKHQSLKQQIKKEAMNHRDIIQRLRKEKLEQIALLKMSQKGNIQSTADPLYQADKNLETYTEKMSAILKLKEQGRQEAIAQLKIELHRQSEEFHKKSKRLRTQYDHHIKIKTKKLDNYIKDVVKDYQQTSKQKIKEMEDELMDLYIIYKKDKKVIQSVMDGNYTNGIRSHNIPSKDLQKPPKREKRGVILSNVDENNLTLKQLQKQKSENTVAFLDGKTMRVSSRFLSSLKEITQAQIDLDIEEGKLEKHDLIIYVKKLRQQLRQAMKREKQLKKRVNYFEEVDKKVNIRHIVNQKNDYRKTYRSITKLNVQTRLQLDNQKKFIQQKIQLGKKYDTNPTELFIQF